VPLLAGGLLELPLGLLAGEGRRRRLAILGGGIIFVLTLLGVASARSFAVLMCSFVAFYPASGAFVTLTQAEIMDAWPDRQAKVMARWNLAGSTGAVAGPLLLTLVLASGGGWRVGYLVLAGVAALIWLGAYVRGRPARAGRPRTRMPMTRTGPRPGRGPDGRERSSPRCGTGKRCAGWC